MDVEYTWILRQGENCLQFRLLTWTSSIGQFVHPVGGKGMGGYNCFSQLQVFFIMIKLLFKSTVPFLICQLSLYLIHLIFLIQPNGYRIYVDIMTGKKL